MLLLKKSWKISSEDEKIGSRGGRCAGELRRPQPSFFLLFFFCLFIASFNRRFCQQIVNQMQFWCHTYLVGYFPYHALVKHGRDSICKFAVPILARIQRRGCDWASVISTPPLLDQTSIQFNSILTLMKPAGIGERSTQCSFFKTCKTRTGRGGNCETRGEKECWWRPLPTATATAFGVKVNSKSIQFQFQIKGWPAYWNETIQSEPIRFFFLPTALSHPRTSD